MSSGLRSPCRQLFASCVVLTALASWPREAAAQLWIGGAAPRRGSVEISAGVAASGGFDLGKRDAEETRNVNTPGGPFTLFTADSRVSSAPAALLRLGVYLSPSFSIETGIQYARPMVSSRLSGDAEQAPELTADEKLTRYVFDGSLLFHLTGLSFAEGRGVPFIAGGGGYLRELHERNEVAETGGEYHAAAGVKLWFGRQKRRLGMRADVGASVRSGGVDFQTGGRMVPTAGVGLSYLF